MNRPTGTLTAMLNRHNVPMSARKAGQILGSEGIILKLVRPSIKSLGEFKSFKILSGTGLQYGRNTPSKGHNLETTIEYYVDAFPALVENYLKKYLP